MKHTSLFSTIFLLLAMLTACGGQPTTEAPETTDEPAAVPDLTDAEQAADACDAGFRLFEHALLVGGPVCIPEEPKRIAHIPAASFSTH